MPAADAAAVVIGAAASIPGQGANPDDPRTRKDDRYRQVKCRKCGEHLPIET